MLTMIDPVFESGKRTLRIEAEAIQFLADRLDKNFSKAAEKIFKSKGRLIITGIGKSGVIGMKLAATFSSTGTSSFFLHPAEAIHGDLGMVHEEDIILALSYSGETDELLKIVPFLKEYSTCMISMTSSAKSTLAKSSDYHIQVRVEKEACPNNLAPTASTTASLAMGDALAVAIMEMRGFKAEHFAKYHPGGALGKKLLTCVADIMRSANLPIVSPESTVKEVVDKISAGKLGLVVVKDEKTKEPGIITDGDLRRAMDKRESEFFNLFAKDIMTKYAKTIKPDAKLVEAEKLMTDYKIGALIVTDRNEIIGVVQIYDVQ